jgi:hypothetical protein
MPKRLFGLVFKGDRLSSKCLTFPLAPGLAIADRQPALALSEPIEAAPNLLQALL